MIYITSDLHLGHNKDFLFGPRGFSNIDEHDKAIVENWNSLILPEDDVYVLGDLMLNDNEKGISLIKQLNGNLHVILGNHDTDARIALYKQCENIVETVFAARLKYKKYCLFLTHYPCLCGNNGEDDKPLYYKAINLCGHSHTKERWQDWDKGLIYHCELDAHENRPVLLDTVIDEVHERYYQEMTSGI